MADESLGGMVFDAEKITKRRLRKSKIEYLVKWKGKIGKELDRLTIFSPYFLIQRLVPAILHMGARGEHPGPQADPAVREEDDHAGNLARKRWGVLEHCRRLGGEQRPSRTQEGTEAEIVEGQEQVEREGEGRVGEEGGEREEGGQGQEACLPATDRERKDTQGG